MLKQTFRLAFALFAVLSLSRLPASAQNYVFQSTIADSSTNWLLGSPAVDAQGNVYILPFGSSDTNVRKYDRSGQFLGDFALGKYALGDSIAADQTENILILDDGASPSNIKEFNANGSLIATRFIGLFESGAYYPAGEGTIGFTVGRDGNYYLSYISTYTPYYHGPATYTLHIARYDTNANLLLNYPAILFGGASWNGGYNWYPAIRIAVDSASNTFVANTYTNLIQKVDSNGNVILTFGGQGSNPGQFTAGQYTGATMWMAIDTQNRLFVTDKGKVQIFSDNGAFLTSFGTAGSAIGQLGALNGITLDKRDNALIVNNGRIDIYAPSTNVAGTVALEGVYSQAGAALPNVTVQFRAPGTTAPLFTRTVTLTPDSPVVGKGAFTIANVPPGMYDITFKAPNSLQTTIPNVPISGMGYGPDVFLRGGDANNDNSVDSSDFGLLIGAYNSALAIPGSGYDASADFNYDGSVDSTDFFLLIGNFNANGDL